MKRFLIAGLAALMLASVLTACSGTATVDPYGGYSNVSTTDDGRVNGTNGTSGMDYGTYDRSYNGAGQNRTYGSTNGSTYGNTNGSTYGNTNGSNQRSGNTYGTTGRSYGTTGNGMAGSR